MVVMRNTAVTKHELKHKVDRFKDVGVEKMLDLLEDVEIEPAAKTRTEARQCSKQCSKYLIM